MRKAVLGSGQFWLVRSDESKSPRLEVVALRGSVRRGADDFRGLGGDRGACTRGCRKCHSKIAYGPIQRGLEVRP